MHRVYLSLGSNIGDSERMLQRARVMINILAGHITATSPIYTTQPWGLSDQPVFYNQCVLLTTTLSASAVFSKLLAVERHLDKYKPGEKYGPRNIDIDVLLYDDQVVDTKDLKIPHPRMHLRNFVLIPLAAIAEDVVHPVLSAPIGALRDSCEDDGSVQALGR